MLDRRNDHPYRAFLHRLSKPARYTGGEFQSVRKDWDATALRYALAFPDVYDIGMSHLGTKILYGIVNELPWALGERVFAPWPDLEAELRERRLPLVSLESFRPLRDFDVIGFSLQYELTYTNLLNMLDLGGVAVRSSERADADPIIIAGGPTATHPEPLAPFIDAFIIGDGEETLPKLLDIVRLARANGVSRREILLQLAENGAVYCPALYSTAIVDDGGFEVVTTSVDARAPVRVQRHIVDDINDYPFPDNSPVAAAEAIFDRMSIEIARGCTEGCRFCQAGMIYRPVRERSPQQVIDSVMGAIEKAGYDEVSMTTLSTADYSCISPLIKEVNRRLKPQNTSLSVASLRAYGLAEDLLDEIGTIRASSLTFAPEAGTQRMRDVINKNVTEENLHTTAHRVFSRNWSKVKCYFMIGLPTEEKEDVEGIVETAEKMRDIGRVYRRDAEVTVSVSSHVPKPHTPFQWAKMDSPAEIDEKQQLLYHLCKQKRLKFRRHDARTSFLEGVLGRGDRRVANAIERAWRDGARFDGWDEHLRFSTWVAAFEATDLDPERYLGRLREDIALPWDHIDVGLEDGFLKREWKRAVKNKLSPPCGKPVGMQVHHTNVPDAIDDARKLVCYHCGVACDMKRMREERVEYLEELGALQRPAERDSDDAIADATAAPDTPPLSARKKRRGPPRAPYAGPVYRFRIRYSKAGAEALTSHLDMVRNMPRLFRRAGLPLRYSDGYHPKPVMAFAPALPLGAASDGELMDIDLVEWIEPAELLQRLNDASTEGFSITDARHVPAGASTLANMLHLASYRITLRPSNAFPGDDLVSAEDRRSAVQRALWEFLAAGSWVVPVSRRRKTRHVDLRRDVADLGLSADGTVRLTMRSSEQASGRPPEVLAAALGALGWFEPVEPIDVVRVGWFSDDDEASAAVSARAESRAAISAGGL